MRVLHRIRVNRVLMAGAMAAVLLCGAPLGVKADDDLMQEVQALGDAIAEALVNDDVDAMLAFYTEDAISLPNFEPRMQGVEAFKASHAAQKEAGMKINSFSSTPTEVWEAGDNVIEIGSFQINIDVPGMGNVNDVGKYITIYERDENGKLKIVVETWNTDMNPMTMMAPPEASE